MLTQCQTGVAIVFDDIARCRQLSECYIRLLLLGNGRHLPFGRGCKQWQWLIAERLDHPERVAPFQFQRGQIIDPSPP